MPPHAGHNGRYGRFSGKRKLGAAMREHHKRANGCWNIAPFDSFAVKMKGKGSYPDQLVFGRCVNIASTFNLGPLVNEVNLQGIAQMFPSMGCKSLIERMTAVFFRLSFNMPCLRRKMIPYPETRPALPTDSVPRFDGRQDGSEPIANPRRPATRKGNGLLDRQVIKSTYRRALVLLYAPGNAVITGTTDESFGRLMAHMFCFMLSETAGIPAVMYDFKTNNNVLNCQMQHGVNIDVLAQHSATISGRIKKPQKFPMAVITPAPDQIGPRPIEQEQPTSGAEGDEDEEFKYVPIPPSEGTTALVSHHGCINITGAESMGQGVDYLKDVYNELWQYQTEDRGARMLHITAPSAVPLQRLLPAGSAPVPLSMTESQFLKPNRALLQDSLDHPAGSTSPPAAENTVSNDGAGQLLAIVDQLCTGAMGGASVRWDDLLSVVMQSTISGLSGHR